MGQNSAYRAEIDGLRALAIIPVVLFHAGAPGFQGGFVGVDIFFVISGYLITRQLAADIADDRFSILRFYERRARRILPALFVVVLACVPFAWLWMLPSQMAKFGDSMAAVAGFASNILFWRQDGYFDEAAEFKPLLHTWSLAVEEQFYILFPPLLYLLLKLDRRRANAALALLTIVSFLLCEWGSGHMPAATFYLAPARAWELLAGSLCALCAIRAPDRLGGVLAILGLGALIWAMTQVDGSMPYPSAFTLIPVVGTTLIIQFAGYGTFANRILAMPALVWIGLISYSTYLWHQPLFAFARLALPGAPPPSVMWALAIASFCLGFLSWRFVEQPFRRARDQWSAKPTQMLFFSLVGTALLLGIGLTFSLQKGLVSWVGTKPLAYLEYTGKSLDYRPCVAPELVAASFTYCRLPSFGPPNAAIIGDSHAEDKFPGLDQVDHKRRWMLIANSSCPPVLNVDVVTDEVGCEAKTRAAIDYILRQPSIQTVALSYFGGYSLTSSYAADHLKSRYGPERTRIQSRVYGNLSRSAMFERGLADSVARLVEGGKQVIIFVDQPELPFLPLDCIKGANGCAVPVTAVRARQALHRRQLEALQRTFPTVRIFDPLPALCSKAACSYEKSGRVTYRDSHHLSLVGSERFAESFQDWDKR